ncbi:MAG TPA: ABC transporter permease [Thermoanaerobaculia bacterium]|nr:ABC transporter permease [Thermoanaerobaculia bacterium]
MPRTEAAAAGSPTRVDVERRPDGGAVLKLFGALDVETTAAARREVAASLAGTPVNALDVDGSGIEHGDMSGMSLLYELAQGRIAPGVKATIRGLRPEFQTLLSAFPSPEALAAIGAEAPKPSLVAQVGAASQSMLADARAQMVFLGGVVQGFGAVLRRPRSMRWREVGVVFEKAGVNALPIVSLISLLMGLVIAFEAAQPLAMFGAQIFIANMIGLVMIREFSPIFTAIIFAGRSGSAFAAEIGTMKVNEELNALETMGLDPLRFLVIQRVFAGTLLMPVLAAYSMVLGVFGGILVMLSMGFPFAQVWAQLVGAMGVDDVIVGVSKSFVFGAIIAGLGCLRGMQTKEGPNAVGDSTTRAVVAGILMIIVVDAIYSILTYVLHV